MGTCRFILGNYAATALIKNGSGGSPTPPVRSEVAPFVMDRALNGHRRSLWKAGAQNSTIGISGWQLDLDFSLDREVTGVALHGITCPGGEITGITPFYLEAYPGGPSDYIGTQPVTFNGRDAQAYFPNLAERYWSILIEATAAPVIGRIVIGSLLDLGVAPNPGSQSSEHQNRLEQVADDGSVTLLELGYPGHDFTLNFDPCTAAVRGMLQAIAAHPGSVTYIDPEDRCFEVFVRGARPDTSSVNTSMYSVSLEMARLP